MTTAFSSFAMKSAVAGSITFAFLTSSNAYESYRNKICKLLLAKTNEKMRIHSLYGHQIVAEMHKTLHNTH